MTEIEKKQVEWLNLNVKVRLSSSKIHGVGVFALRNIKKGETLLADISPIGFKLPYSEFNELTEGVRDQLLGQWPQIVNGSMFAYPTTRIQAYINHSAKPNYDAKNDIMLEDIEIGAEITEDYRLIENYAQVFPWIDEKKKRIMKK